MKYLTTFVFQEFTGDGYPVAAGGICPFLFAAEGKEALRQAVRSYQVAHNTDTFALDYSLAAWLKQHCPADLYAVGVSIRVPGIPGPTGGVIGYPRQTISSADGISEPIGHGLSVAAYPGGPGIVINGSPDLAEQIIRTVQPGTGGEETLRQLADHALKLGISTALLVADGTGTELPGCVMILEGGHLNYVILNSG